MKGIVRFMLAVLLGLVVVLPGTVVAQDDEWTCDEGPHDIVAAVQAAYDAGDYEMAWQLAAHSDLLCHDPTVLRNTNRVRVKSLQAMVQESVPGKVDLGDYALFMRCLGEGSPVVIFENGLGQDFLSSWIDIYPVISTETRVCVYNRLGILLSTGIPSGVIRTTQDQVNDLIALLDIAEVEPPYILVGHSIGGINISLFVDQYPDLVEGIVLVDAAHPDQEERWLAANPDYQTPLLMREPAENPEQLDILTSLAQAARIQDFGTRPLAVVTAGLRMGDPIWVELQEEYGTYSTNSRHIIAEHSDHFIMATEPELIIDAILWVLDEVRAAEN